MGKSVKNTDAGAVFQKLQLKKTPPRLKILSLFPAKGLAISCPSLLNKTKKIRPSTVYRILFILETRGIIYKFLDNNRIAHYTLRPENMKGTEIHLYLSFHCKVCKKVYCFTHVLNALIKLRKGFSAAKFEKHIAGVCSSCQS